MRAGGTVDGELWVVRIKNLRPLDHIRAGSWLGDRWDHGEALAVLWAEPTGLRDGYYKIRVQPVSCPSEGRVLCIKGDDNIAIVARDVPADAKTAIPKQAKSKKPKKGEQMKLF